MLSGDKAIELWEQVRQKLKIEAGDTVFNNWLGLMVLSSFSHGKIVIAVRSKFHKDWIEPRYGNRIRTLWQGFSSDIYSVNLIVDESLTEKSSKKIEDSSSSILNLSSPLDPRYTFEKFVVGPSNNFVAAAAERIAESDDVTFNPLVIYGGVGLGKTHLMHSIAWKIRESNPNRRVVYLSAEKFMYQFVRALRQQDTMLFKEQFRSADVLMIDDVQFIAGKNSTQEEFFNTFNALFDQNRLRGYDHTSDDNSRKIFSMIAGPAGVVDQAKRASNNGGSPVGETIDIVPTIAHILGFLPDIPAGMLPGRVLNEAFNA